MRRPGQNTTAPEGRPLIAMYDMPAVPPPPAQRRGSRAARGIGPVTRPEPAWDTWT